MAAWRCRQKHHRLGFQHTATRRWLPYGTRYFVTTHWAVSTHSHPKVAAAQERPSFRACRVSTHSHPKVAAYHRETGKLYVIVSTHSHPKVAACKKDWAVLLIRCFNTQPPEGGCALIGIHRPIQAQFQHTATRRWLRSVKDIEVRVGGFNTQPPEGGCQQLQ